jgi:hypothetical protein
VGEHTYCRAERAQSEGWQSLCNLDEAVPLAS